MRGIKDCRVGDENLCLLIVSGYLETKYRIIKTIEENNLYLGYDPGDISQLVGIDQAICETKYVSSMWRVYCIHIYFVY